MSYEPIPDMTASVAMDRAAMDRDIAAGRVLYLVGESSDGHMFDLWAELLEFMRIANRMVKLRRPRTVRLLMTYDDLAE